MPTEPEARKRTPPLPGADSSRPISQALAPVLAYHERTKHSPERYAAGPETLDWSAQPNPFREFAGAPRIRLPLAADQLSATFAALHVPGAVAPQPLCLDAVAALLELSFGLSAWKSYGPDTWAVRCNPSSGNLHPTEAYLFCLRIPGLEDGIYHYLSRDHALEQRCRITGLAANAPPQLRVGLSSVTWREAWKYGERAFRYCLLDTGHALGALRYAAATLGWGLRIEDSGNQELAHSLGLDRDADYAGAEREEAELLLEITTGHYPSPPDLAQRVDWAGQANTLDPYPMYQWPVIDEVAQASRKPPSSPAIAGSAEIWPARLCDCEVQAAVLIRRRRSAQRFDGRFTQDANSFYRMLDALLPRPAAPWDAWSEQARVHPLLFVHRVEGLAPGLYALPRTHAAQGQMQAAMRRDFTWTKPAACPAHLPLFQLAEANLGKAARAISCHQAIAADCTFTLAMLAEFDEPLQDAPWRYRQLHWEAGLLGQVLYLEAEAAGLRGTGVGCFFDDVCHELLGLQGTAFQSLYHFTVGYPLVDERIASLPPYPEQRNAR